MTFADIWWQLLILVVCSYFLGNVNFAILLSKVRNRDITRSGSGNPGTMNMLRTFGIGLGAATLGLDVLKGFLPALAGRLIFRGVTEAGFEWGYLAMYLAGLAVVLGHVFPCLHNRGGKGVATTIGVFLCGWWWVALICFLAGVLYIFFFEYGGVGSLIMITGFVAAQIVRYFMILPRTPEFWVLFGILLVFVLISFVKHRGNLARMAKGVENRTKLREMIFGKKKKEDEDSPEEQPPADNDQKN